MAKKFFYVCAGLFVMALAFAAGASMVRAQSSGIVTSWVGQSGQSGAYVAVAVLGRSLVYSAQGAVPGVLGSPASTPPVPGSAAIISVGVTARSDVPFMAMLETGEVYEYNNGSAQWSYAGGVLGAPTPATSATWGQVKDRYRK